MTESSIMCANIHHESGEIEIVIKHDSCDALISESYITSLWITKEEIIERGCKFELVKA